MKVGTALLPFTVIGTLVVLFVTASLLVSIFERHEYVGENLETGKMP